MSKFTEFRLLHDGSDDAIREVVRYYKPSYPIDNMLENTPVEWKWFKHDEDMLGISEICHDVLFTLYGRGFGIKSNILWCKYYKNGQMYKQKVEVVFEDFDVDKLR